MTAYSPHRVLVLDGNQRSALAVTRSLGSLNELFIAAADSTTNCIAGSSRFCSLSLTCPAADTHPAEFLEWLEKTAAEHRIDALFPVTEITSQLLLMNKERFKHLIIPYADYDLVMTLADKGNLYNFASSIDVNVPRSVIYKNATAVEQLNDISYPVVVKPCLSRIWLGKKWLNTTVQIAQNQEQLESILNSENWLKSHPFMLQEFIPGHGAGVFAIYNQGNPVAFFAHRRLREKPPQGGVSVLSQSVDLDPLQLEQAKKLLDQVGWHGVAMVEFRVTDEGVPYLMEVNTRFWGSLQLAIDSGVDFPQLLWQVAIGEKPKTLSTYRTGNKLRWFLGDLDSLYLTLKGKNFSFRQKCKRLFDFCTPHPFVTRHEVNRWPDFKPAITELKQYISNLVR